MNPVQLNSNIAPPPGVQPIFRSTAPTAINAEGEHTGKSVNYYIVDVNTPTRETIKPYTAECNDIIEALGMNYAEANVFKAIWRIAAARQGKLKKGNSVLYDAEKANFFANRVLIQNTPQQEN